MRRGSLVVALLIVATTGAEANPPLSSDELRRLDRGEVLVLDVLPPGAAGEAVHGGTAVSLVRASPEAVWRVLVDYRGHRGLYPRVVGAEVLAATAEYALVRYVVGVGPFAFGFHISNYADPARRRLEWQLDRGRPNDLFQASWGYWEVDQVGGRTILTYAMAARTTLPAFLTRGAERQSLVDTIKAVRERAERSS